MEGRHVRAWIVIIFRSRERKEGEREVRREGKRSRERERERERERKPSKGRPLVSLLSLLLSPRRRRLLAAERKPCIIQVTSWPSMLEKLLILSYGTMPDPNTAAEL